MKNVIGFVLVQLTRPFCIFSNAYGRYLVRLMVAISSTMYRVIDFFDNIVGND